MRKKVLITGHCGYVGTQLVKKLLEKDYEVIGLDTMWYHEIKVNHSNLISKKIDIREISKFNFPKNIDCVFHLANIANDPSVELNEKMSWEVNVLAGYQLIERCVEQNVKRFIFASSGSVYGLKNELKVTEDLNLIPISAYNKTKMIAERVFMSFNGKIEVFNIRPATVCGISERMRLDLSVNMLTYQAIKNNVINVFGGKQIRPNIHIDDLVDVYMHFFEQDHPTGIYNAGFENLKIIEIAKMIQRITKASLNLSEKTNDNRSYRLSSDKLLKTGFKPKKTVAIAINELVALYKNNLDVFNDSHLNVTWLKKNNFN